MGKGTTTKELRSLCEGSLEHRLVRVSEAVQALGALKLFGESVSFSVLATWPDRVRVLSSAGVCVELPVVLSPTGIHLGAPVHVPLPLSEGAPPSRHRSVVEDFVARLVSRSRGVET